ncbi:phage minor head protein [Methylobacterium sp. Gmos1]
MSDAALLARWDKLMETVERPYARALYREKNRYIEQAAAEFASSRKLLDRHFHDHVAMMGSLAEHYDTIAIRLALVEALKGDKALSAAVERKEAWDRLWHWLVRRWIVEFGAQRAKETADTTRADMQRVIDKALAPDAEFNPVQVATQLLAVRGLSVFRAITIARTETHGAMMFASQAGAEKVAQDNGLEMLKRWVPVQDGRTRDGHAAMAGSPAIPMDQNFTVSGEKMARPGDPRGSASNVVHCRCVLAFAVST